MKPTSSFGPELVPPLVVSVVVAVAHSGHKLAALCVGFRTIARQIFFVFGWHQKSMNQLMKRVSIIFKICITYTNAIPLHFVFTIKCVRSDLLFI